MPWARVQQRCLQLPGRVTPQLRETPQLSADWIQLEQTEQI